MTKKPVFFVLVFLSLLFFTTPVLARIGVGVNTGKIEVTQKLKSGMIYNLPSVGVINTGTETTEYSTSVAYQVDKPELRPGKDWLIFTPQKFTLEPGKVQIVKVKLNLPVRTQPGNYFAYLEAQPLKRTLKGRASIGVAAASKLYFTVVPANIFEAIFYKVSTFWQVYAPWPQRALWAAIIIAAVVIAKNYLNINIDLKKPAKGRSKDSDKE